MAALLQSAGSNNTVHLHTAYSMTTASDCIVIGGGVIGLMSALALRRSGLSVTLLEQAAVGKESSWAGGGILSPLYPWKEHSSIHPLVAWGQAYYPSFCDQIHRCTGIDPEYYPSGMLIAHLSLKDINAANKWGNDHKNTSTSPTKNNLKLFDSDVDPSFKKTSLYLPQIASIRNPRFLQALHQYAIQQGIVIRNQTHAQLAFDSANKAHIRTQSGTLKAQYIVVTAGAWSQRLLAIDIFPVKGQMLLFNPEKTLLKHIIIQDKHYLIPRRDGRILAGSTLENSGFNKNTTLQARQMLRKQAIEILPALKNTPIERHWAGLRPGTSRDTPFVGKHPASHNLYLNTGHFRNGFSLAPASAQLLTDLILQKTPLVDPTPFSMPFSSECVDITHFRR